MRRVVWLLLAALLLSGCAALTEPEPEPDRNWAAYQQGLLEEDEPEDVSPEEDKAPAYPSAFSMAYHKGQTLDPITCGEGIQEDVAALLYEPLFQLDSTFQPVPLLCESCEWDERGLVCTLNLRQDVTFQDGSPLTAKDVVDSLRRAAASERYGYRLRNVAAVSANRAGQVVITLATPNRGLPALLDIPVVKSGTEDRQVPVGTGPYLYLSGSEGNSLLANEEWWQRKPLPAASIPLVHAKDRDTAMYLFSSHQVELLTVDPTSDKSSVSGQAQTTDRPTAVMQFIGFNMAEGRFFASPAARAAFSHGIARDTLVDAQLAGLAVAAQFPISPLSPLYPAELEGTYSGDWSMAQAAAEQEESRELSLLVSEGDGFRLASAQFIAGNAAIPGWEVTVRALPWEEYLAALEAGDFDLYFGEVRLTADWDLTDLVGTGGALNYGGYSNLSTDTLLAAFAAAEDRPAAARQLAANLLSAAPIAPICFKNNAVLTHPGVVEGLDPSPGSTFQGLERWIIHLAG